MPKRRGLRAFGVGLLCASFALTSGALAQRLSDDAFLRELSEGDPEQAVDRERLAELFHGSARRLAAGRPGVASLTELIAVPDETRRFATERLDEGIARYERAVRSFNGATTELASSPLSRIALYDVLSRGQRLCWQLDLHLRELRGYGLSRRDLRTVRPSQEACARFRTAAFQPRVEALLREALIEQVFQREEIDQLRGEVRDAEELIEALRELDASE